MVKHYLLYYHKVDDTIEMYDVKLKRTFLKRCSYPSVKLTDLYVGSQINVYARQLKIIEYGDGWTQNQLSLKQSRNLVVVKPNAYGDIGRVMDHIFSQGLQLAKLKMMRMSDNEAHQVFGNGASEFTVGPIVCMEVLGTDVKSKLGSLADNGNMVHVSQSAEQCTRLLDNPNVPTTAQFDNCTVCVIRPHALHAGVAGAIVDNILKSGFEISAMQIFNLDRTAADEFLEVYRNIIPEYNAIAEGFTAGPCLALEIRGQNIVEVFREFTGPVDPEVARLLKPNSIRAEFGEDKVKNAVHCTDLAEDGVLESEYFFSILQKSDAIAFNRQPVVSSYTSFRKF